MGREGELVAELVLHNPAHAWRIKRKIESVKENAPVACLRMPLFYWPSRRRILRYLREIGEISERCNWTG